MDKGHPRSAWPPHSYENISFMQERYESVALSRHMGAQIRAMPTLHHKVSFAYEWFCHRSPAVGARRSHTSRCTTDGVLILPTIEQKP
jgi:hypothetical protein